MKLVRVVVFGLAVTAAALVLTAWMTMAPPCTTSRVMIINNAPGDAVHATLYMRDRLVWSGSVPWGTARHIRVGVHVDDPFRLEVRLQGKEGVETAYSSYASSFFRETHLFLITHDSIQTGYWDNDRLIRGDNPTLAADLYTLLWVGLDVATCVDKWSWQWIRQGLSA